ncbi:MAG: hypothetical protein B6U97_01215 [Candidatus Altiarchaeales archaeon ex4484_96]|nr:MAG: hypothetical protein B6U97_01215 [Candidatus Altiarchaeales archaeon ex4484_96]
MSFKTITIKQETYSKLSDIKGEGESFTELLDRLASENDLLLLKKLRATAEFKNKEAMLEEIYETRSESRII